MLIHFYDTKCKEIVEYNNVTSLDCVDNYNWRIWSASNKSIKLPVSRYQVKLIIGSVSVLKNVTHS